MPAAAPDSLTETRMSIRSRIAKPTGAPAVALVLLLLLLAALPPAARAQCSLTNATTWCAHQDSSGVSGGAEDDDHFGGALAFGDFDGDGFDDLAVGAPGEDAGAGFVHVFYSNSRLLSLTGQQAFDQDDVGGDDDEGTENGDHFGAGLATGDFDDDGFDDLVVGSPGEDLPDSFAACILLQCEDAGGVHVLYGSAAGLQLVTSEFFDSGGLIGGSGPREDDRAGSSFAVGDFSLPPDGIDDLAVGGPGSFNGDIDDTREQGEVFVSFGSPGGLNAGDQGVPIGFFGIDETCDDSPRQLGAALAAGRFEAHTGRELAVGAPRCTSDIGATFYYSSIELHAAPERTLLQSDYSTAGNGIGDHFGAALAAGDFDDDGLDDLAAGAPNKNHGTGNPNDSGRVYVAYTSGDGPDPADGPDIIGEDEWAGDTPGEGELFGSALAAGDVDGDGIDDLLAGAPGEGTFDVGRVYLKRGSATGLTTANNALFTETLLGGSNGTDDHLGNVIALGDVDGDGVLEIALGVPDRDVGATTDGGMVYVTRAFGPRVFADGFESGGKAAWSASTP